MSVSKTTVLSPKSETVLLDLVTMEIIGNLRKSCSNELMRPEARTMGEE